jgi:hypothetical protein
MRSAFGAEVEACAELVKCNVLTLRTYKVVSVQCIYEMGPQIVAPNSVKSVFVATVNLMSRMAISRLYVDVMRWL